MYLILRFIIIFSLYAQSTALSYHIYSITNNVIFIGYIGLAEIIPAFLFSLQAGHIADKNDKQKLLLIIVFTYLIIAIGIWFLGSSKNNLSLNNTLIGFYIFIFFNGVARAFLSPVSFSILGLVTPINKNLHAINWSTTAWYLGSILGPLLGSAILAWRGLQAVSLVSISFLIVALICVLNISKKPPIIKNEKENIFKSLQKGIQFIFGSQLILSCLLLDLFSVLFGGAEALLPVFSKDILHISAIGFGWLRSAHGLGSIFLTFLLTFFPLQNNVGKKLLWSVAGFGLCMICFAICHSFYLSFLFLFLGGMADCVSVVTRQGILQKNTPLELKGRVSSVNMLFISSSNELGTVESSIAAKYLGTIPSVVFGGIITLFVVLITAWKSPKLLKLKNINEQIL